MIVITRIAKTNMLAVDTQEKRDIRKNQIQHEEQENIKRVFKDDNGQGWLAQIKGLPNDYDNYYEE